MMEIPGSKFQIPGLKKPPNALSGNLISANRNLEPGTWNLSRLLAKARLNHVIS
jgi:hypothetical protein